MSRAVGRTRLFFDELCPERLYTLHMLKAQHAALLILIPSDGRSFEEFLFDALSRNGGTIKEYFGSAKPKTTF